MVVLVLFVVSVLVVTACGAQTSSQATVDAEIASPIKAGDTVIADAKVMPLRDAALGLSVGGIVAQVLVAEGDLVTADQLLVQLDAAQQSAAVKQAEATLARAQAALARLEAGAREEEIAVAQRGVEIAQARLIGAQAELQVAQGRLTAAETEVTATEAELASAEALLAVTEARLRSAQLALDQLKVGSLQQNLAVAQDALQTAQVTLVIAAEKYDPIAWQAGVDFTNEGLVYRDAVAGVEQDQTQLEMIQAGATDDWVVKQAQAKVDAAQGNVDAAQATVEWTTASLDAVRTNVEIAQAAVDAAQANVDAAQAQLAQAEAQLALVEADARPEDIAAAQADVASAEAALTQARDALAKTELRAPFAGTVASLDLTAGEQVAPGVPIVWLADLSAWRIETDDLTELDVVYVSLGDAVTVTFDALPGLKLAGQVTHIKDLGENKQGDMTYTVVVALDQQDDRLRWNMTAAVAIEPQ